MFASPFQNIRVWDIWGEGVHDNIGWSDIPKNPPAPDQSIQSLHLPTIKKRKIEISQGGIFLFLLVDWKKAEWASQPFLPHNISNSSRYSL